MRYSGTWLTPADEAILESLRDDGPAGPIGLVDRDVTEFSGTYIDRRCVRLAGRGGLITFDRGRYRLTDRGKAYLDGTLDPSELSDD